MSWLAHLRDFFNFTPCGSNTEMHTKTSNEYEDEENGKILPVILFLVNFLEGFTAAGRKFVVTLDNFFTLPKVMKKLRDLGIGCVGTARGRMVWPPLEFNDDYLTQRFKNVTFNHLY